MKRLSAKRKRALLRRSRREERKRKKHRAAGSGYRSEALRKRIKRRAIERVERAPTHEITAPKKLSLILDPDAVVRFLDDMEAVCARKKNVHVDLKNVEALSPEAIALFLSRVIDERFSCGMRVSGNVPADPRLAQMLVESRFFDFVTTGEQKPKSTGTGEILSRQSDKVDSEGSYMVLQQIDATIPGDVFTWDGIQRLIVEAMTNTENHARGTARGRERWWLSVHCDRNDGVARFCFFDNGIGIFESLRKKRLLDRLMQFVGNRDRVSLLRHILQGKVPSSTGLGYRGKGLPKIAEAHTRKQFKRLVILSNNVYVDIENDDFRLLDTSFSGTFFYWEHHAT